MDIITTKIVVGVLFGLIRFISGILPIKICIWFQIHHTKNNQKITNEKKRKTLDYGLALFECFGGGVLFATCFLHMIPEVYISVKQLRTYDFLKAKYPYSQLVVSIGFFLVYFVEELCHWVISLVPKTTCKDVEKQLTNSKYSKKEGKLLVKLENGIKENENEEVLIDEEAQSVEESKDDQSEVSQTELVELIEKDGKTHQEIFKCILVVMALSFHAFFEGLAVGIQHSIVNIWYLFIPISVHSGTILFSVGLKVFLKGRKIRSIVLHMIFLAITSPLGVFLGLFISVYTDMHTRANSFGVVFLEGLSTGTILYITFFEILSKEKERRICSNIRALSIAVGFTIMAGLECFKLPERENAQT